MEAKKHSIISKVGEGVLKDVLERGNPDRPLRLGAFYLGNWITDVSQIVDPVAYRRVGTQIHLPDVNAIFQKFLYDAPSWIRDPIESSDTLTKLREKLQNAEAELQTYIRDTLNAGKSGDLGKACKEAFRYLGYFKFVAPTQSGVPPRMDPDSYLKVFDRLFIQYFPYEHLDRPEASRDHYADKPATGPRNKFTPPAPLSQGDLYDYLRDNIQIASSRFAYLDAGVPDAPARASWAEGTFNPLRTEFTDETGAPHPISDASPAWNYHLALLGHGLHAVEDFYAHSTFVEHASIALPANYKRVQKMEDKEILLRRLKKWHYAYSENSWEQLPEDGDVVTGYFDFVDTIISIKHLAEELFGWNRTRAGQTADEVLEYDYAKLLDDTLEFISNPKGVLTKSNPKGSSYDESRANEVGKWLWEKYEDEIGKNIDKLKHGDEDTFKYVNTLLDSPMLKDAPPEIKDAFLKAAKLFGMYKGAKNLYKTVKEISEFLGAPWEFVSKHLKDTIVEKLVDQVKAYVSHTVDGLLGGRRIGCHSLIAKDTGEELYCVAGMACAETVHWYVVNTLARHGRGRRLEVCRGSSDSADNTCTVPVYCSQWIDWLELVEYFLAHPLASVQVTVGTEKVLTSIIHVTASDPHSIMSPDSLKSLEGAYRPSAYALDPVGGDLQPMGTAFTWETIADANFPTKGMSTQQRQRQINKILAHQPDQAVIVSDGINYAFRPGYRLVIPNQGVDSPTASSELIQRRWWYSVIVNARPHDIEPDPGVPSMSSWYAADGSLKADAPAYAHRPIPIPHADLLKLVDDSEALRKKLERAYNAS